MDGVSISHLISFSDIKQNVLLSPHLNRLWHHKLWDFFINQPLKQWLTGEKRGEDENTKIRISRERKELFRWNKKHFSVFEGLSFGEK